MPSGAPHIFTVLSSAAETSKVPSGEGADLMHPPCADGRLESYSPTIEGSIRMGIPRAARDGRAVGEYATAVTASVCELAPGVWNPGAPYLGRVVLGRGDQLAVESIPNAW